MPARAAGLGMAVLLAGGGLDAQSAPEAAPFSVEEMVEFRSFPHRAAVALSPDGRFIAYTVEGPARSAGSSLPLVDPASPVRTWVRVTDLATGETVELGRNGNAWAPSWDPSGTRLAFHGVVDGRPVLRVWEARTGVVRTVSEAPVWVAWMRQRPRWLPGGDHLVTKLLPEGRDLAEARRRSEPGPDPEEELAGSPGGVVVPGSTARVLRAEGVRGPGDAGPDPGASGLPAWLRWRYGGDLAVVEVDTGEVRRIARGGRAVGWWVSPRGTEVAVSELSGVEGGRVAYRLARVALTTGARTVVAEDVGQAWGEGVSWSPGGERLAWSAGGDAAGIFVASVASGEVRRLGDPPGGWSADRAPVWTPDGDALLLAAGDLHRLPLTGAPSAVAPDPGRSVIRVLRAGGTGVAARAPDGSVPVALVEPETGRAGFGWVGPGEGRVRAGPLDVVSYDVADGTAATPDAGTVVARASATRRPPDLWLLTPDLARNRRVSELNPAFDPGTLARTRLVRWTTDDGEELRGTLFVPPDGEGTGGPGPLVVEVYGGDSGAAALRGFHRTRQLLATRGYRVLVPDVPLREGAPLDGHARSILPAVSRLVEDGVADPERVGLLGHSYGGYGTLALLVATDRFAAAVASAAQGNLAGMFGHLAPDGSARTEWLLGGQGRMGVPPWEDPERYVANSPTFRLHRVHAPLLLLHGADDRNTPVHLAEEVFVGLRHLGRSVTLVRYEDEGHWWGTWSVPNQVDYWTRVLEWFDRHLSKAGRGGR